MSKAVRYIALPMAIAFVVAIALASSDFAYAAENVGFAGVIAQVRTLVSVLLLPIGILIAAWRIIYLALVCGLIGIDPLEVMDGGDVSGEKVRQHILDSLSGFIKGLCWVGGIFIVFQFAMSVAATLAETMSKAF